MRTVNFRDGVLFPIADLLGIEHDDKTVQASPNELRKWITFIDLRTQEAWEMLNLPETRTTEERAFRTIWNATAQFRRVNASGVPDELFYLPNTTYYQVNPAAVQDPPIGTIPPAHVVGDEVDPGGPPYFIALAVCNGSYIDLDQRGRHPIGEVLGVYARNPRYQTWSWHPLEWRLSDRGIEVRGCGGGTSVFVRFKIRPSKFTATYWDGTASYIKRTLVYHRPDGNVSRALVDNTEILPTSTATWAPVPMPAALAPFVVLAAASDAAEDLQTSAKLLGQAEDALERAFASLSKQGERTTYRKWGGPVRRSLGEGAWCCSPSWTPCAEEVTTLTDIWQDDDFYAPDHWVTETGEGVAV